MDLNEFKQEIEFAIQDCPSNWRYGQKVFNYLDVKYKVAREIQFNDEIDCFYDDNKVDLFIEKAYNRLFANNKNVPYKIWQITKSKDGKKALLKEVGYYTSAWWDSFYHFFLKKFYIEKDNVYTKDEIIEDEYNNVITVTCDKCIPHESEHFIYEHEMIFYTDFGSGINLSLTDAIFEVLKKEDFKDIENRNEFVTENHLWKKCSKN